MDDELDPATWPDDGLVGYGRAGDARGHFFFLLLATAERAPESAFWQGFFQPPLDHGPVNEEWADHESGSIQELVKEWAIEWASPDISNTARERLFGIASHDSGDWPGAPRRPSSADPAPYGRASTIQALGGLLADARASLGLDVEQLSNDGYARGRISAEMIAEMEAGSIENLNALIALLKVLDYDLAIIPKKRGLLMTDDDPWAEFR